MSQPPQGPPPPWGYYPPPPPQPPSPSNAWQIVCGAVIGLFGTVVAPFAGLGLADSLGFGVFVLSFLLVPCVGIALLISAPTRPWGIGLIIGWAIALVLAGGACVALLSSLG
jgi:hypothetical protein